MSKKTDAEVMKYGDKVLRCMEAEDQHFIAAHTYAYNTARVVGDRYRVLLFDGVPNKEAWARANEGVVQPKSYSGCNCR